MTLDIRLPMGWLFTLLGILLLGYGLLTGPMTEGSAAGLNVNAWWGAALLLFGACMLLLARRAAERARIADR